jgi:signal transduction histidine kinase
MMLREPMTEEIARCRAILSAVALTLLIIDGTSAEGGSGASTASLAIVALHFAFACAVLLLARRGRTSARFVSIVSWLDAGFAVALAIVLAAVRSPFFAFAMFAVVATALNGQRRQAFVITITCIAAYALQGIWHGTHIDLAVMRGVCLTILGYLIVRLARKRLDLETKLRVSESAAQRGTFARQIHDGCAPLLAAVDVRLETARELIRLERYGEALENLAQLRERVRSEQVDLREYSRRLADVTTPSMTTPRSNASDTRFNLDVRCEGSADVIHAVLAILRESIRNVENHARATTTTLQVRVEGSKINVEVVDDGVGFAAETAPPWSIASRVAELGGLLTMHAAEPGARLSIVLPRS